MSGLKRNPAPFASPQEDDFRERRKSSGMGQPFNNQPSPQFITQPQFSPQQQQPQAQRRTSRLQQRPSLSSISEIPIEFNPNTPTRAPGLVPPPASLQIPNRNTGVSLASTTRIEAHLKAGNPLYIDVDRVHDASKCPNATPTPSSTAFTPASTASFHSSAASFTSRRVREPSTVLRILTFGIPVDGAARSVLLIAFMQGLLGLFTGIDNFSQSSFGLGKQQIVVAGTMVAFGAFIMGVCLNGFTLMWSASYRRSPTAATVFMINCILTMILMSASTFLWIFYAAKPIDCSTVIVPTGKFKGVFVHADDASGFRQSPICLRFRDNIRRVRLFWGTILAVTAYFFVVLAIWAVHYRRRVLLARLLEEAEGEGESEDVGLVVAKAPMGRESPMRSPDALGTPGSYRTVWAGSPMGVPQGVDLERAYRGSWGGPGSR